MTQREKLIELLSKKIYPRVGADPAEVVADYLIDNGVTVQEHGERVMKRCLVVILDDDYNEHYVEELNPAYETTIRCDGESWVAFCKPKDAV